MFSDNKRERSALLYSRSAHNRLLLSGVARDLGYTPFAARSPLDAVFALGQGGFSVAVVASDPFRPADDDTTAALAELIYRDNLAPEVVVDPGLVRLLSNELRDALGAPGRPTVRVWQALNATAEHSGAISLHA